MPSSTTPATSPAPKVAAKAAAKAPAKPRPTARSTAAKRAAAKANVLPEDHTPSEAAAHAIRMEFGDLTPSVNRIMNAGLHEAGTMHAITLFRESLGVPGDENRNPAVAIEAGRLIPEPPAE